MKGKNRGISSKPNFFMDDIQEESSVHFTLFFIRIVTKCKEIQWNSVSSIKEKNLWGSLYTQELWKILRLGGNFHLARQCNYQFWPIHYENDIDIQNEVRGQNLTPTCGMTNPYFWAKCLFYDKNWGIRSHYQPVEWLTVLEMLLWLTEALKTPHFLFDWSMKKWCKYVMLIYSWPTSQKWNFEKILKNIGDTDFLWSNISRGT